MEALKFYRGTKDDIFLMSVEKCSPVCFVLVFFFIGVHSMSIMRYVFVYLCVCGPVSQTGAGGSC